MYSQCQCVFIVIVSFIVSNIVVAEDDSDDIISNPSKNITGQNIPSLSLKHFEKKSYYNGNVFKGNFFQAEQFCRVHGMNLVSINSKEENEFIQRNFVQGDSKERFWSSGTRLPDSEKWIWFTTGKPISYLNWAEGQPNQAAKDDECVEMRLLNRKLKWYNRSCWEDLYFICEVTWKDCLSFRGTGNTLDPENIRNLINVRNGV